MTHPALLERITRSLAYMLRHQPERFGLQLDAHGFGAVPDVVRALNERLGEPVDERDMAEAISSGDRPRYEIQDGRVRALYGHSIVVEPGEPSQPPEFLFVGIDARDADRATRFGLRGGRRRFLHLALNIDDAREAGRRAGRDYSVLRIFALDAWEEGINFYDRKALYLAEHVPTQFLEVVETNHDGYEPRDDEHGAAEGRGGHPDRREHGRREHGRGGHGRSEHGRREHARPEHGRRDYGRPEVGRRDQPRLERSGTDRDRTEPQRETPQREARFADEPDRGERGRFGGDVPRQPVHADAPRQDGGARGPGGGGRERTPRHQEQAQAPVAAGGAQGDRPRERQYSGHHERPDRGPRRDERRHDRREEHREREQPAPPPQRAAVSAPRESEGEVGDFGLGVFEQPKQESLPARRAPAQPPPPAPRPAERHSDVGDFGAGL